jgi:putative flippase GtrA
MIIKDKIKQHWFFQYIMYGFVGGINYIIDIATLNVLMFITQLYHGQIFFVFKLISLILYSINGYYMNRKFTFRCRAKRSFLSYAFILLLAALANGWILSQFTMMKPVSISPRLWANIVNLGASLTTGTASFLLNKYIIFKKNKAPFH